MDELIDNDILDESDNFFQSKHINKRKEEYARNKAEEVKNAEIKCKEAFNKLTIGQTSIFKACYSEKSVWQDKKEKIFLETFLNLSICGSSIYDSYVDNIITFYGSYHVSCCIYDFINNSFLMKNDIIFSKISDYTNMNYIDTYNFIKEMLKKYFQLDNITLCIM